MESIVLSLKKIFISLILALFCCGTVSSQSWECFTPNNTDQNNSSNTSICTTTENYVPYYDHPEYRPIVYLNINIHFFQHLDGTGNFTTYGDGYGGSYTGNQYATDLINYCNEKLSTNCDWVYYPTNQTIPSVGPTQIRFKLYTDPANPKDKGIYFHQIADQYYYYSWNFSNMKNLFSVHDTKVIDVWIQEYPDPNYTSLGGVAEGMGNGADEIKLTNIWRNWPSQTPNNVAGLLDHETGHLLGLSHAWYTNNCPALIPGYTWNVDNNVMNYNGLNCNWSGCQLGVTHEYLTNYLPPYVSPEWCIYDISKTIIIHNGENITWNASRYLQGDVIVESGSHLTIKCNVYLPQNASIIVKPNAFLSLDGGKLSSACGQMWSGIEIWGDRSQHQYSINGQCLQGIVELINGATIENAYNAIALWHPNDWNSMGGILKAEGATFKNNHRAVEFMSYHNFHPAHPQMQMNNLSYFSNCQFITDNDYFGSNPFYAFISMWDVEGIQIKGCKFINQKTFNNNSNRGYGIYTMDANYNVVNSGSSGSPIHTEFQGLFAGVLAP